MDISARPIPDEERPYYDRGFHADALGRRKRLLCDIGKNPDTGERILPQRTHDRRGLTPRDVTLALQYR